MLAPVGAALAAAVLMAGCGGGGKKSSSTTSGSTTTAKQTKPKAKPTLQQTVRTGSGKFASSVGATNGDTVQFRTVVPPAKHPGPVSLKIQQKNGRIQVTASANHQKSTATVTTSGLKLSRIHYACDLPPAPSFCPVSHLSSTSNGYQLQFPVKRGAPTLLAGLVSSKAPPAPKLKPTTTAVVSPYVLTQKIRVTTPSKSGSAQASKPTSAATVHPGDVVTLSTYVGGKTAGALQPVTVTINQGPAKTVTIIATEPGGTATHATISGANGAKIALTDARYNCFLPPDPTFCPSSTLVVGHRKYDVTFRVTPNKSPVDLVAKVQPG